MYGWGARISLRTGAAQGISSSWQISGGPTAVRLFLQYFGYSRWVAGIAGRLCRRTPGRSEDVELFRLVQNEISRREMEPRNKKRSATGTFIVRPVCAHCGIEYHGGRLAASQGSARTYVHGVPKQRLHGEFYDRFVEHGCRQYNISADALEEALKDLIVRERTSDEYERDVRAILLEKEGFKASAAEAVATAEARVDSLSAEYRKVVRLATTAGERGLDEEAFFEELQRIQQKSAATR